MTARDAPCPACGLGPVVACGYDGKLLPATLVRCTACGDHRDAGLAGRAIVERDDALYALGEARRESADLRTKLDATAQAYDDLVAQVWRAAGETHEPPADVGALLARVAAARREGAEAMREACAVRAQEHADAMREAEAAFRRDDRCDAARSFAVATAAAEGIVAALRALPLPRGER